MWLWSKFLFAAMLILMVGLVGCGGGGDNPSDSVTGTWRGPWQSTSGESGTLTITFNGDGSYLANDGSTIWAGTFSISGNTITSTLNDPSGGIVTIVGTRDGNTMTLTVTSSRINGEKITATLTKID